MKTFNAMTAETAKTAMTNRDYHTAVMNGKITDEVKAFAKAQIDKMNEKNATRTKKQTKAQTENDNIKTAIVALLSKVEGYALASDIGTDCDISANKASALCRQLVEDGELISADVKVPKKGTRKGYAVAKPDAEVIEKTED